MKFRIFLLIGGLLISFVLFQNCGTRTGGDAGFEATSSTTDGTYTPSDTPILTPDPPVLPPTPDDPVTPTPADPIKTSSTRWGTNKNEEVFSVQPVDGNEDGVIDGYITVGHRNHVAEVADNESKDILFTKYGEDGSHKYTVIIGKNNVAENAIKVLELPGSYLILGTTVVQTGGRGDRDILLLKINKGNGSVEFSKRVSGPRNEMLLDAQLVDIGGDLNIIAVGYAANRTTPLDQVGIFMRFDLNFNVEANKDFSNSNHKLRLRALAARGDNIFAIGYSEDKVSEATRAVIFKLSADGNLLAVKRAGTSKMLHFTGLRVPAGKNYLVASGVHSDGATSGALVEFSESLFVNKAFRYGTSGKRETFTGLDVAPGGNIVVTGHYDSGDSQDILVSRLKQNYDIIWSRKFGTNKNDTNFHNPISFRLGVDKNGVAVMMSPATEKVGGTNLRDTQLLLLNENGLIDKANCGNDKGVLALNKTDISSIAFNNFTITTGSTTYAKESVNLSEFASEVIPNGQVTKSWCRP